jgi:hypothetical protein
MGNVITCVDGTAGGVTAIDKAVFDLKVLKRNLCRRAKALEDTSNLYKDKYRDLERFKGASSLRKMTILRHIGALEKALHQCHLYLYRADEVLLDIGEQTMLAEVTHTLQEGSEAVKRMNALLLSVGDVEKILKETAKARTQQHDIDAALRGRMSRETDWYFVSDDELEELRDRVNRRETSNERETEMPNASVVRVRESSGEPLAIAL